MKLLLAALLVLVFAGCEKKPTEEEVAAQEEARKAAMATPKPTPKPGNWMWENHKNPLEQRPKPR